MREMPGKGRCLFACAAVAVGETVLSEAPIMVSKRSDAPELFALCETLHAEKPFHCGHIRSHFAALFVTRRPSVDLPLDLGAVGPTGVRHPRCTLGKDAEVYDGVMDKGAPRGEREKLGEEVARVGRALREASLLPGADLGDLAQLICGWEFNGFPAEDDALDGAAVKGGVL